MTSAVAFIESNTSGTGRLFARAAAQLGFKPVLLTSDPSRYKYAAEDNVETRLVQTTDDDALLEVCRDLKATTGLAGVMTSSEYFVTRTAVLARTLRLPGASPAAMRACRDKHKQRTILNAKGVAVPAFRGVASARAAVAASESLGLPVVIKTVGGSGSVGVKLCRDLSEVKTHAAALLRQRVNERGMSVPHRILVEELVQGPEYSVETFCQTAVGCTSKQLGAPPFFVETGHDFPAGLSLDDERAVCAVALQAIAALGLDWGPAHVELRLSKRGPVIIEVNPRLAGGFIPELVRCATGIDLITETVRLAVGIEPKLNRLHTRHASIRFLVPEKEGVLLGAEGLDQAKSRALAGDDLQVYAAAGSEVRLRGDFRDRVGHVMACRESAIEAARMADAWRAAVQLKVM